MLGEEIVFRLQRDGFLDTLKKSAKYTLSFISNGDEFDRLYGTNTGRVEPVWRLNSGSKNLTFAYRYEPVAVDELIDGLKLIDRDFASFTFIDLGCGKGRALLLAPRFGFKSVLGIEFSPKLAKIARRNIEKLNLSNTHVIESDAAVFKFPTGNLLIFMNNPFGLEVLRDVANNLATGSAEIYVLYCKPRHPEAFDELSCFRRTNCMSGKHLAIVWRKMPAS
jgi:SAM-dependent methyltransferase